ncbi:hypothetical protein HMPREF3034_01875 [Prevotella sp. DNF00663]|uniref:alpha/beta hydrolase-fold protein n=1 Tax=Prevotella sp. DNF00663 TaxID=1384078 RepID=UPI00079374B8|nr:alpha/beta hydrolase-fold protein [Prevotella sp. DNF00663]KXB81487.1 hypothetical protein HMPREF3034_01875 [Prevotella sp. DNF00663]
MEKTEILINKRNCRMYGNVDANYVLIQPVDEHNLEVLDEEVDMIAGAVDESFLLVAYPIEQWLEELSPWSTPPVFGKQAFGDGAADTLQVIIKQMIPALRDKRVVAKSPIYIIGGYSLAGLFALWVGCQSNMFQAVVAASPSVWFPRWLEFAEHHPQHVKAVYLSLGDREEHTRNQQMVLVGECIRRQYELCQQQVGMSSILEWNPGNHFQQSVERTAKGFIWALRQLSAS